MGIIKEVCYMYFAYMYMYMYAKYTYVHCTYISESFIMYCLSSWYFRTTPMSVSMLWGYGYCLWGQSSLRFVKQHTHTYTHTHTHTHAHTHTHTHTHTQISSDDVYSGSVEEELSAECPRNRPSVLKVQRSDNSNLCICMTLYMYILVTCNVIENVYNHDFILLREIY